MLGRVFLCQIVFATHSVYLKPPCAHARLKAKGRKHEMRLSSCFRLATRHAKMRKCEDERQNHDTRRGVFSRGDLSPRHTQVRHFSCVAFSPMFVVSLPGGAKGRHAKTRQNRVLPRKHVYTTWHKSATIA